MSIEISRDSFLRTYDNEDIEGWLIEEGIGYRNRDDSFEYGADYDKGDSDDFVGEGECDPN